MAIDEQRFKENVINTLSTKIGSVEYARNTICCFGVNLYLLTKPGAERGIRWQHPNN